MDKETIIVFTRYGMGHSSGDLSINLAMKFLTLINDADTLPSKILLYTDGIKLACEGSPVIGLLNEMERKGVELVLCGTCLNFYSLSEKVKAGIVGGMTDMIEAMQKAPKVLFL